MGEAKRGQKKEKRLPVLTRFLFTDLQMSSCCSIVLKKGDAMLFILCSFDQLWSLRSSSHSFMSSDWLHQPCHLQKLMKTLG